MSVRALQKELTQQCRRQGFSSVCFTSPPLGKASELFSKWLEQGYAGKMEYLSRRAEERQNPHQLLPELKSIIVLAHPYDPGGSNATRPDQSNISRYAWGKDYHQVLGEKLKSLQVWLQQQNSQFKVYTSVDTQPVLEKGWAAKAGLGWLGKHTNIIDPEKGSYFFISVILSNIEFKSDEPQNDRCGSCVACVEACPTNAIVAPYVLDANLCISYLTIELKGSIPRKLRPLIGNRIFGCDDCQEVCPWNRFSQVTSEDGFKPQDSLVGSPIVDFLSVGPNEFKKRFKDSPILRPKWKGFMRNVLVAIGNSGRKDWADEVKEKLRDPEPLVRGHAVWAYHRLLGEAAEVEIIRLKETEQDSFVLEEIGQVFEV